MKTLIPIAVLVTLLSGCATAGGAHAVATPWGAAGVYSFKDNVRREAGQALADRQVAQALDAYEQPENDNVRVASR